MLIAEQTSKNFFNKLYFLYVILMTVNFFLTENPYSALHSGGAGHALGIVSYSFKIAPNILIFITLILLTLYTKNLIVDYKVIIAIILMFISGMFNQGIFEMFQSYIFNASTFIMVSSLAFMTFNKMPEISRKHLSRMAYVATLMLFFGVCLAMLFPNRYGILPFEFSRVSRGEVTYWNVTGLIILYPVIALAMFHFYKVKRYIVISLVMTIIVFSTASRMDALLSITPFIIMVFLHMNLAKRLLISFFVTPIILLFSERIVSFFYGFNPFYSNDITNGRAELWSYHWSNFIDQFIWGSGAFFLHRNADYNGVADSEIGFLVWFSENGLFFGVIMSFIVLKAVWCSFEIIARRKKSRQIEFIFAILFLSMLPNIFQSYSRILNINDLLFWFSTFYVGMYKKPIISYLSVFNIKD